MIGLLRGDPEKTRNYHMPDYTPEIYCSRVARQIQKRGENYIAGDDHPYYRYKRLKFLRRFLDSIDFGGKVVMELGCGPGGNLRHIMTHHAPTQLIGVDISQTMLDVAGEHLRGHHGERTCRCPTGPSTSRSP
jgi:ubiquinone/menaquinone biosynthesis C-methylase UbiE